MARILSFPQHWFERKHTLGAVESFVRATRTLRACSLGRLAERAVAEFSSRFSREELRRLAFARLCTECNRDDVDVEDWLLHILVEIAMQQSAGGCAEPEQPQVKAMESFYL